MSEPRINSVIQGDVLAILSSLPNDCVDIIVTSPPYNKRNKSQDWLVNNRTYSDFTDHMPEGQYQEWQNRVLSELYRLTRPGGSLFYNHKIRWDAGRLLHPIQWIAKSNWVVRQEVIWDRGIAANMRGWRFWQVDERVYWLNKPLDGKMLGQELASKHAKMSSIWRFKPVPRIDSHPAPMPLELAVRAIYSVAETKPRLVLDPFCGTGTTLVAAKLLEHHYIGIDLSQKYVDLSLDRLINAEKECGKMQEEVDRHFIEDPFKSRKERGTVTWPFGPRNETR